MCYSVCVYINSSNAVVQSLTLFALNHSYSILGEHYRYLAYKSLEYAILYIFKWEITLIITCDKRKQETQKHMWISFRLFTPTMRQMMWYGVLELDIDANNLTNKSWECITAQVR